MIIGTGIDAANISRFSEAKDGLVKRILSKKEYEEFQKLSTQRESVRASFLASRFAAKEAYSKARGTGFSNVVIPNEITVDHDESGKPFISLEGETLKNAPSSIVHLSLTHEEPLAIAMVIIEGV